MDSLGFVEVLERSAIRSSADAAALVVGVLQQSERLIQAGRPTALPRIKNARLCRSGQVTFTAALGSDTTGDVEELAQLLQALLGLDEDSPAVTRLTVPGGLMVLIARALRRIDLPPPARTEFVAALLRAAGPDALDTRAAVFQRAVASRAGFEMVDRAPGVSVPAAIAVPSRSPAPVLLDAPILWRRAFPPWARTASVAVSSALAGGALGVLLSTLPATRSTEAPAAPRVVAGKPPASIRPAAPLGGSPVPSSEARGTVGTGPSRSSHVEPHRINVGAPPRPLVTRTMIGRDVFSPSFAASGGSIYFHAGRSAASLMRASIVNGVIGDITRVIDDGSSNYHVVPSPDGTRIAFDSDRDGERGVYVANADGSSETRVSGDGYASVPSWSPDGRQLAFVKAELRRPRVWNIWILDVASGAVRRVTQDKVGQPWGASWFRDGHRLAYSREEQLVILDLASGRATRYRSPIRGRLVRTPAVNPQGDRVVFQVYGDGVWMLDLRRGTVRRLLNDSSAEEFRWSPQGDTIVFHARRGSSWGVWAVNAMS